MTPPNPRSDVTLDRATILDTAHAMLRDDGLQALSMRRLAQALDVAPGALYWHVPSKQDLLAEVAELIVAPLAGPPPPADPHTAALTLRQALLAVRDGADVVSFALTLRPRGLRPLRDLTSLFSPALPAREADWAARALILFVLGAVAEEQNRDELTRAGHLADASPARSEDDTLEAFRFGIEALLTGLETRPTPPTSPPPDPTDPTREPNPHP